MFPFFSIQLENFAQLLQNGNMQQDLCIAKSLKRCIPPPPVHFCSFTLNLKH